MVLTNYAKIVSEALRLTRAKVHATPVDSLVVALDVL